MGIFDAFIADAERSPDRRRGRRPRHHAGRARRAICRRQFRRAAGHASTYVLQDENGNIELTHSISAGLDYAAVGPEHAWLHDSRRAEYAWVGDDDAFAAFQRLAREEGIIPALESAHAVAHAIRIAPWLGAGGGRAHQSVRARRQGRDERAEKARRRRRRGSSRKPRPADVATSQTFARIAEWRARRPRDLPDRRRSRRRSLGGAARRGRARRRRRPRSRRAVLGSAGRRPCDSTGQRASAGRRHVAARRARDRSPRARRCRHADRSLHLRESGRAHGSGGVCAAQRPMPASTAC